MADTVSQKISKGALPETLISCESRLLSFLRNDHFNFIVLFQTFIIKFRHAFPQKNCRGKLRFVKRLGMIGKL